MASFFSFTDVALRVAQDCAGKPWPHMVLKVRAHESGKFRVEGNHPEELGSFYDRAAFALAAIREFCRRCRYTATVSVYTPDNRHVFHVYKIVRTR